MDKDLQSSILSEIDSLKRRVAKLEGEREAIKMILSVLVKNTPYTFQMIRGCDSKKAAEFGRTLEQFGIDNGVVLDGRIFINPKSGRVWLEPYEEDENEN